MTMKIKILTPFFFLVFLGGILLHAGQTEEWKEYKKKHFIIYYKNAPEDFVKTVEETAEEYYVDIAQDLGFTRYNGWTWEDRAKIYIFDDADDYVEAGKQAQWSHGIASPQDKTIRTFPSAHGFFDSTLPHEIAHIIFREFVGFKAEIPLWFEEGVAMSQEKARRWGTDGEVKKALEDGRFIPLDELSLMRLSSRTSKETIELFYAESASVVNYLINDLGKSRFVRFCRKLSEGGPFEWAIDSVYVRFRNLKQLNDAWVHYLKNE